MNKVTKDLYDSLKRSEWSNNDSNGKGCYCYACGAYQNPGQHEADCHIGNALAQYELVLKAEALIQDDAYMKWLMEEKR